MWDLSSTRANLRAVKTNSGWDSFGISPIVANITALSMGSNTLSPLRTMGPWSNSTKLSSGTNLKLPSSKDTSRLNNCTTLETFMKDLRLWSNKWRKKINSWLKKRNKKLPKRKYIKSNMILKPTWTLSKNERKSWFNSLDLMKFGPKSITLKNYKAFLFLNAEFVI